MIDSIAFYYINWPIARGIKSVLDSCFDGLMSGFGFYTGNWVYDIAPMDKDENIFSHPAHAGSSLLTFFGGLKSNTISLYL